MKKVTKKMNLFSMTNEELLKRAYFDLGIVYAKKLLDTEERGYYDSWSRIDSLIAEFKETNWYINNSYNSINLGNMVTVMALEVQGNAEGKEHLEWLKGFLTEQNGKDNVKWAPGAPEPERGPYHEYEDWDWEDGELEEE